ncbi:hypothetical protein UNDYM_5814 [Undibacterium sp. YM2]|uniref:hypothetical protein n=1 Tax=Undibacterium sp. YM2 TaxID=2058625 RepID=UPI001331D7F6|nr:hypothetical protein [Undibacterium sp. YM2]BBB70067.1 hypothetical protein UNDYM_5814 [Undibacterium sp. YM2]
MLVFIKELWQDTYINQATPHYLGMIVKTTLTQQLIQNLRKTARALASVAKVGVAAGSTWNTYEASYRTNTDTRTTKDTDSEMFNDVSPINFAATWFSNTSIRGETLKVTGGS